MLRIGLNNTSSIQKITNNQTTQKPRVSFGADSFVKTRPNAQEVKQAYIECAKAFIERKDIMMGNKKVSKTRNEKIYEKFDKLYDFVNQNDLEKTKLYKIVKKYKETLSLEDKKKLLKHEEKLLWQELETPEIAIIRNLGMGNDKYLTIPEIRITTLKGLSDSITAYKFLDMKFDKKQQNVDTLTKIIKNTPDDSSYSKEIKLSAFVVAKKIGKRDDLIKLSKYIIDNTTIKELKKVAISAVTNAIIDEDEALSKIDDNKIGDFEKKQSIINLSRIKSKKLQNKLPILIKDKATSPQVKIVAVWATGKCKSKENFDLLYEIANNKEEKDIELREMALHSLALYLRHSETKVKNTLKTVSSEKSDLSALAQVLLDKCEGKYHQKDRELSHLSKEQKEEYKKARNNYIKTDFKLNTQKINVIDRALSSYPKSLSNLEKNGSNTHIIDDTVTKILTDSIGEKTFRKNLLYDGNYIDVVVGANLRVNKKYSQVVMHNIDLVQKDKFNTLAHEFKHNFHRNMLDMKDDKKLQSLYKKAIDGNKCLDSYAALTNREYFAQGYEAYQSVYKPHSEIINDDYESTVYHTKSTLKRKDPELYDFIEYCIDKYK